MNTARSLDCVGLFCPMPIVKTKIELEKLNSGEVLEVIADDPGFLKDLPAWCEATGNQLMEIKKEGIILKGYVKKK